MIFKKYISFTKKFFFSLLLLSFLFSLSSIFWTTDAPSTQKDMLHIKLGFPLSFISQDQSKGDLLNISLYKNIGWGIWYPSSFAWDVFFLNIVIIQICFSSILFFVYVSFARREPFFRFLSIKNIIIGCFIFLLLVIIWFWTQSMRAKNAPPLSPEMMQPVLSPITPPEIIQPRPLQQ